MEVKESDSILKKTNENNDKTRDRVDDESQDEETGGCCCTCCSWEQRYVIVALTCLGMLIVNAMRTNVGFTVVTILDIWAHEKVGTEQAKYSLPAVQWTAREIALLHSVFYIGMFVTQIPAGYLTTKVPSHRLYGVCILISCSLNLLLPICVDMLGYTAFSIVRALQGCSEGLLYPSCYGLLRHWSTPEERGRIGSFVLTSAYAGAIVGFMVDGFITHYIGWQYVYYLNGAIGIFWFLFWLFLSHEKPYHHPSISKKELDYFDSWTVHDYENMEVPWKNIMTSLPVLSICLCHIARNWVFILMLTNEPFYMSMFGFNMAENGVVSAIPHICKVLMALLSGLIADYMRKDSIFYTTYIRKLLTGVGFGAQALCFYFLACVYDGTLAVLGLSMALGFAGLATSGWQINHYDLSVRYASILVSISSTTGAVASIFVPLVMGEMVTNNARLHGWHIMFIVTGSIIAFAAIVFLIFGSGDEQLWSKPPPNIELVQKVDPLVRKPYGVSRVQKPSVSSSENGNNSHFLSDTSDDLTNYGSNTKRSSTKSSGDENSSNTSQKEMTISKKTS